MKPAKVVDRVRKLLRLSSSTNAHEAARAAEQARAIMDRYHLSDDDVVDNILEVADSTRDPYRDLAAGLAAQAHGCSVAHNKRGELGFRGMPDRVRRAVAFYRTAVGMNAGSQMPPIGEWIQPTSRRWFDFCWWEAFAQAVHARLAEVSAARAAAVKSAAAAVKSAATATETVATESEEPDEAATNDEPDVPARPADEAGPPQRDLIDQIRRVIADLDPYLDVRWLRREAVRSGRAAGETILLDSDRALPGAIVKDLL